MNAYYLSIIVGTLVGFCGLAYLLLAPIWRFLDREEEVSDRWTKEALARRRRRQQHEGRGGDGQGGDGETRRPAPPGEREDPAPPDA
jgi:hypothetical protein